MTPRTPRNTRLRTFSALVLAAVVLAGCSTQDDAGDDSDATGGGLLPAAEGSTEYPLTLTTWAGESVLEERPERVAVIGLSPNVDAVQALGVTPVYTFGDTVWEWRDEQWLSQIELVDEATRRDPLNLEGIASTEPDLIIANHFLTDEADYERLSEIAPVLDATEQAQGDQVDWRENERLIGETLDLADAAEESIDEADEAVADVEAANPEIAGKTATFVYEYNETGMEYYTATGGAAEGTLVDLGFEPNPLAEDFSDDPAVSDERLASLDADMLVVFYNTHADRETREDMDLFQRVPAVEEGRYLPVVAEDEGAGINATWVLRGGTSSQSLPWVAEVITDWVDEVDLS